MAIGETQKALSSAPQLLLLDGPSGSGKSSVLEHLRDRFTHAIHVGRKFTSRSPRPDDNSWEFDFVQSVPIRDGLIQFSSVGHSYAIDVNAIHAANSAGCVYATTCVDLPTISYLRSIFATSVVFLYRPMPEASFRKILDSRCIRDASETQRRLDEFRHGTRDYIRRICMYSHVILNVGGLDELHEQVDRLVNDCFAKGHLDFVNAME